MQYGLILLKLERANQLPADGAINKHPIIGSETTLLIESDHEEDDRNDQTLKN